MKSEQMKGTDAMGREVVVTRWIPETDADIEELRRRAVKGEVDHRSSFSEYRSIRRRGGKRR